MDSIVTTQKEIETLCCPYIIPKNEKIEIIRWQNKKKKTLFVRTKNSFHVIKAKELE